jgi:dipeptidase D
MVCEKNRDVVHDFDRDPIATRIEGEWVAAIGTTLGADNGIGVAAALAAATDPAVTHGPLELLFTVDEETGLTGAKELDGTMIRGRILLNLDSEEDGVIYVGCAGGCDTLLRFPPVERESLEGWEGFRIEVGGLRGGHSGMEIGENRGNALRVLARILRSALVEGPPVRLAVLEGGSKRNAIPREAVAVVAVPPGTRTTLEGLVRRTREGYAEQLSGVDDGIRVNIVSEHVSAVYPDSYRDRLVAVLTALPHGVLAMSRDLPGLVETSSNLAVVDTKDGSLRICTSSRSSVAPALQEVLDQIAAVGDLGGVVVETQDGYPGWKPRMDSRVLSVVRDVLRRQLGREPEVAAIHAGLECGLLGEKVPGLDMVSFGPTIRGAHSPDERVHVPSVARFWSVLTETLEVLSRP